jgi:putative transposase
LNYIHFNPVKDSYCQKMTEWPWSSARDFLRQVGKTEATELWRVYPPADSRIRETRPAPGVGP